jgi:hypothetical protein
VEAPDGMIVNELPEHRDPLFTETTGRLITVTLLTAGAEETQPEELVPVTEYAEVVPGVTVKFPPVTV